MSNQAGIWHYDKKPVSDKQLNAFERQLMLQGPDSRGEYREPGLAMLYRAYFITEEDRLETQPFLSGDGTVLMWDGRLDNREEILRALGCSALDLPTDIEIVNTALAVWGTNCLSRLLGKWALSWWNPKERRLLLARDYIGIRKIYYLATKSSFYWATDLAAIIMHSGERFTLSDEYFAGYFTAYPEPQLTPYAEVQLVPPGGYLQITPDSIRAHRYWSFNSLPQIRYRSDNEYEEHFRYYLRESVRRELRTCYPVLADLSGGLDSSSIVCVAYDLLRSGEARGTMNTISYFTTEEKGGDERPWIFAIENHIGRSGTHIELRSPMGQPLKPMRHPYFAPLPGYFDHVLKQEQIQIAETAKQGNRLHLSGLGGDELLGGVPNPIPNLASLLWGLDLNGFREQLISWALQRKTTVWSLLFRALISLAPIRLQTYLDPTLKAYGASWLRPEFIKQEDILRRRLRVVNNHSDWLPGPAMQDDSYLSLCATIAGYLPRFSYSQQHALPYYDRDLVQYLYAIPGDQILRAHERRSLMRRALRGLVPDTVLDRDTKWLGRRLATLEILENSHQLSTLLPDTPISARYIDVVKVESDLNNLRHGQEAPIILLERLLGTCFLYTTLDHAHLWQTTPASDDTVNISSIPPKQRFVGARKQSFPNTQPSNPR